MRWSIRYQLLVPLLTLLLGVVVGITAWSAVAAVRREQSQIEGQVRSVARTISHAKWPLNYVLPPSRTFRAEYGGLTEGHIETHCGRPPDLKPGNGDFECHR